jgi:ribonucleoside-diphosphate reductase alpha chain
MGFELTDTAKTVLEKRYYLENEDFSGMAKRVVDSIIPTDRALNGRMYDHIINGRFLPNSPTLMNAGTELGQLSACFVLPIEDSIEGIFEAVKQAALVNKTGGGTGFSFSRLRPVDSTVASTNGVASGPLSFMEVFDKATDTIKQGGRRRGANMGVLRVDHPNIEDFVDAKLEEGKFANFNLSVGITDEFMQAVIEDETFNLIDPKTKEVVSFLQAKDLWDKIVDNAYKNGEPGIVFLDEINRYNPVPNYAEIEATNPCGEEPLVPYGSCNLGSINLDKFIGNPYTKDAFIYTEELVQCVRDCTEFLDHVIDANKYPIPQIAEVAKAIRPIGLGIMGLHDALIQLCIPYDSADGRFQAAELMELVQDIAIETSEEMADHYGAFPEYDASAVSYQPRRNSVCTTIAPTGTLSMIADCSSGCEPYFSIVTRKEVMDGESLLLANKHFEVVGRKGHWYTEEIAKEVAEKGTVVGVEGIPIHWQEIFKTSMDIDWRSHVDMQAALQEHVCAGISKTINLPNSATKEEIASAYMRAWESGCKGITVYRDGSREVQVLHSGKKEEPQTIGGGSISSFPEIFERELLDKENAIRHKVMWKNAKVYLIVSIDEDGFPLEVFAKLPVEAGVNGNGHYDAGVWQERTANWDSVCRLCSMLLRVGMPVKEVVKQLKKSSYSMVDAPGVLARIMSQYVVEEEIDCKEVIAKGLGDKCPSCGENTYVSQGGCAACLLCAYSDCG